MQAFSGMLGRGARALLWVLAGASAHAEGVRYTEFQSKRQAEAFVLTLDEAVTLAVRENRLVKSAYLQRISQRFDLYVSEGKFVPKLVLTTGTRDGKVNGNSSRSQDLATNASQALPTGASLSLSTSNGHASGSSSASTSLTLKQPLLKNGGLDANLASVRMARLDEQVNRLALKSTLSQTVVQVIHAYRELLRAQEQRAVAQAALRRSKDLYEVNQSLIDAGRMAKVDIFQTEAEVANREVALEEANNQIDAARLALLALLALAPLTPLTAVAPERVDWMSVDQALALNKALSSQPDYLIAGLQLEKARINLDYARNQQLWDLSLVAESTRTRGATAGLDANDATQAMSSRTNTSFAGLQLTIPLFDRSIEQVAVRARVDLETQDLKVLEARQAVEQHVRDAVRNAHTRWRQLELSEKARDLSLLKLNVEKDKLQVGRSSNFQVLSFENDLRNAENTRINAQIAYLNALTDLDESMGKTLDSWHIPIAEAEDED